jgi:outer membrane protein TolC
MEDPNRLRSQPETDVMARLRRIVLGTAMLTAWVAASAPPQGRGQPPPEPARANLLIPHEGRISALDAEQARRTLTAPREMPPDFQPWWSGYVASPLLPYRRPFCVGLESLVVEALQYSPKVRAMSMTPEIRRTAVAEALAAFDFRVFSDNKYVNTDDPVGNLLTTGGPDRYLDRMWYSAAGLRQRNEYGGQVEISQRIGYEDSNSIYFVPPYQGTSRLCISYTQPLLNGAGRAYNESVVVLADIDSNVAAAEFSTNLECHLLDITRAYWALYLARAELLQKRRLTAEGDRILSELEGRRNLDASKNQLVRANAAAAARHAMLIRAQAAVENAESRIHALVNDPESRADGRIELLPAQRPQEAYLAAGVRNSVLIALHNRPEIEKAVEDIHAGGVRLGVAEKDLLPVLNAVVAMYVSGLEADGQIAKALADQFSVGAPSYTVGLQFEMPLGNHAAEARLRRRRLELQQLTQELESAVLLVIRDVEVAVREVDATYREMQAKYRAMQASAAQIAYLQDRWRLLPGEEQVAGIVLEDVLEAQERLAEMEYEFAAAEVGYNQALCNLQWSTGTMLKCQRRLPPVGAPNPAVAPPQPGPTAVPLSPLAARSAANLEVRRLPQPDDSTPLPR